MSQLLVFVRYAEDMSIRDEFLFCERLRLTTKAADVFGMFSSKNMGLVTIKSVLSALMVLSMLGHTSGLVS